MVAYFMKMDRDTRRYYRKHWGCSDPQLFDYVACQNGYTCLPQDEEDEQQELRWKRMDWIHSALTRLSSDEAFVLERYYLEGDTLQCIADKQKTSVSTAFKRRDRALKKMRIIMEEIKDEIFEECH